MRQEYLAKLLKITKYFKTILKKVLVRFFNLKWVFKINLA